MRTFSRIDNKIGILGQNILVNNKNATAFYIIDSINYSTLNREGINNHIGRLESLFSTLAQQRPGFSFSLLNVNKSLTAKDVENNLIDTVKLWDPSYKEIPEVFRNHIIKSEENFTLLACNIDIRELSDVEGASIKEVAKDLLTNLTDTLLSIKNVRIDTKRLLAIEKSLNDVICRYGVRASRELTFYTYVSSLYPSYNISYDSNSYITNSLSPILGVVNQQIESHFGYFKMKNNGVEIFGLNPQDTYGCILTINKLPEIINGDNFGLALPNLRVNIKTIPKEKAKLAIKRTRADLEFEEETAQDAGARTDEELNESLDLAEHALSSIAKGSVLCEVQATILLLSQDLPTLKSMKQKMITMLADIDVFASISFDQAKDFVNNYIKLTPSKYNHLCDLRYPLSFQLDNGLNVGDFDSKYSSPAIGEGV